MNIVLDIQLHTWMILQAIFEISGNRLELVMLDIFEDEMDIWRNCCCILTYFCLCILNILQTAWEDV